MRTSHLALRLKIENEKRNITDQELFQSKGFAGYLTDIAEAASKRYQKKLNVTIGYDESEYGEIAYTDNKKIHINVANKLTGSFPTRRLRADSLIGLLGHEIGHVIYTDFKALKLCLQSITTGRMYPREPSNLPPSDQLALEEFREYYLNEDKIAIQVVMKVVSTINNILEDIYIETRMCDTFPGSFKTGILLNSIRMMEQMPSIQAQIDRKDYDYAIITNLILQYARSGDINNLGEYKGEYIEVLEQCIPYIDDSIYDDDMRTRYLATNHILLKLWNYIKTMIEEAKEDIEQGKASEQDVLNQLMESLEEQISGTSKAPLGRGKTAASKEKFTHDPSGDEDNKAEIQKVLDYETGRIKLEKTEDFDQGKDTGITYNNQFSGSGYESIEEDMNRILTDMAKEKAEYKLEEELTLELQKEAENITYGNAHTGIHIKVNRMPYVEQHLIETYKNIMPPLLLLSKRLTKQMLPLLKDKKEGGKETNLLMGKRMNPRAYARDDGRLFYKNRLPQEETHLAVGLLVDESGSMSCQDRITIARATSVILYDFCNNLEIPIIVYGHSTGDHDLELFSYAEFDSNDKKDKFRIMDMSARSGNRDGAALRFVAERLMTRKENTKLLIIISDGQPAAYDYMGTAAEADLRGIKEEYTKKGIMFCAAAIGEDKANIKRIYGDSFLDITDINKLPIQLTNMVKKYMK